jgi:flagellar basal body rod protein FlgG
MLSGIYRAAGAMGIAEDNLDVIANNLANVNVPGFRKSSMVVQTFEKALAEAKSAASNPSNVDSTAFPLEEVVVDFTTGPTVNTGRPLDVALEGDGFFVIEGPDGPLYTRNGGFYISPDGELTTGSGYPVLGDGGPISVQGNTSPSQIEINQDGDVIAAGNKIGTLRTVTFEDNGQLEPLGTTLFSAPDGVDPTDAEIRVFQGFRENSNVSPVHEMVGIVQNVRNHEAAERVLKALDESLQLSTNPRGS